MKDLLVDIVDLGNDALESHFEDNAEQIDEFLSPRCKAGTLYDNYVDSKIGTRSWPCAVNGFWS